MDHNQLIVNDKARDSSEEEVHDSVLRRYESLRVDTKTLIEQPKPIISICNQIIATKGNLFTVSGQPKSGKSAFSSAVLAGAISSDGDYDRFEGLEIQPNPEGKAVVHFDTEQAIHKQQQNLHSILKRAGSSTCPDFFLSFNLRRLDIDKYINVVSEICEAAYKKYSGIHLIVVDGAADFIGDVNDPLSSNEVVRFFEWLAITFNTVVLVVVHTNPGSEKERGHLGSQLQRKSESVLTVKQHGAISYLEPKLLRLASKGDVPPIQFSFDRAKGYHVTCGIRSDFSLQEKMAQLCSLAEKAFENGEKFKYDDAVERIMKCSGKGQRISKDLFKELKAHELIIKGGDDHWRLNSADDLVEVDNGTGTDV